MTSKILLQWVILFCIIFNFSSSQARDAVFTPLNDEELFQVWKKLGLHAEKQEMEKFKELWNDLTEEQKNILASYTDVPQQYGMEVTGGDSLLHYAASVTIQPKDVGKKAISTEAIELLCPYAQKHDMLDVVNVQRNTALFYALRKNLIPIAKSLLECGASSSITPNAYLNINPQMLIAQTGDIELYNMIKDEIDIEAADHRGRTLRRYATLGLQNPLNSFQHNLNYKKIIRDLEEKQVPLNRFGCEYFENGSSTQSVSSEYDLIDYSSDEEGREIWQSYVQSQRAQNNDLTVDHQFVLSKEGLIEELTETVKSMCADAGYKNCILTPNNYIHPLSDAPTNPHVYAINKHQKLSVEGQQTILAYRVMYGIVSIMGLEDNADISQCVDQIKSKMAR